MAKRKSSHSTPYSEPLPCAVPGCEQAGEFKAPKSAHELHNYQHFCLDHIREFNKAWNYFSGMEREEIEGFMKDAVTGHRPTWTRERAAPDAHEKLQFTLDGFIDWYRQSPRPTYNPKTAALTPKQREALAAMEIDYPFTEEELKQRYRQLVKRYHPDSNHGNKALEEQFKHIVNAYGILKTLMQA